MPAKLKSRWVLIGLVGLVILSAACVQLAPRLRLGETGSSDPSQTIALPPITGTTPNRPATVAGRGTAVVQRGSIADIIPLNGRVAGLDEIGLELPAAGKIQGVSVKLGQAVEHGQV